MIIRENLNRSKPFPAKKVSNVSKIMVIVLPRRFPLLIYLFKKYNNFGLTAFVIRYG